MKRLLLSAAVLLLAGCGDHPVPAHGKIVDRQYHSEYSYWQAGTTTCSGKPPICTTTPGYMQFVPASWQVTVQDLHNRGWQGTVNVEPGTYDECRVGDMWPECWGGKVH